MSFPDRANLSSVADHQSFIVESNSAATIVKRYSYALIPIAIGVIVSLAAVFILLSAYQVLPYSVNVINNLGGWGQAVGFGALGVGIFSILGGVLSLIKKGYFIADSGPQELNQPVPHQNSSQGTDHSAILHERATAAGDVPRAVVSLSSSRKTLAEIQSRDVYTLLQSHLEKGYRACSNLILQEGINEIVWIWAIYQMLLEGTLEEEGVCHPILHLGDFLVKDAAEISEGSRIYYVPDWFSTCDSPCYPVKLKRKINNLSGAQRSSIVHIIESNAEDADEILLEIIEDIRNMSNKLQNRYSFFVAGDVQKPIVYLGSDVDIFLPEMIFNFFKKVIQNLNPSKDDLADYEIIRKICSLSIIKLLSAAKLDEKKDALIFGKLVLRFGDLDRGDFFSQMIPNFIVNELTSFNYQDDPVVNTQPLLLARKLSHMDMVERNTLEKALENDESIDKELQLLLKPCADLLMNRYYVKLIKKFNEENRPVPESNPSHKDSNQSQEGIGTNIQRIPNDINGDCFKQAVERTFMIHPSWSYSGSCLLSAVLMSTMPHINFIGIYPNGYDYVEQLRVQIANCLNTNRQEFAAFVEDKVDFDEHIANVYSTRTYLEDVDIEALARVLKQPIFVYKLKVEVYHINERNVPLPTCIFGEKFVGISEPIRLYDDYDHYKLLTEKVR